MLVELIEGMVGVLYVGGDEMAGHRRGRRVVVSIMLAIVVAAVVLGAIVLL